MVHGPCSRSEEIFEFSAEEMVSQKVKDLKNQLCGEFSQVFHLCILVLTNANKPSLLQATLSTLLRFLNWIPLGYIFETDLIRILVEKVLCTTAAFSVAPQGPPHPHPRSRAPVRTLTPALVRPSAP